MNQVNKFMIVEDSYHYYGLWLKGMMEIQPDGLLKNITRGNSEHIEHVMNIYNMCSTRDAMDIDLYNVLTEENLVYYDEEAERSIIDEKVVLKNIYINLTFSKASEALKDKVIEKLKEKGRDIKDIKVKTIETFLISQEKATSLALDYTGCIFDPETYELTQIETSEQNKCCVNNSNVEAGQDEDEIPF